MIYGQPRTSLSGPTDPPRARSENFSTFSQRIESNGSRTFVTTPHQGGFRGPRNRPSRWSFTSEAFPTITSKASAGFAKPMLRAWKKGGGTPGFEGTRGTWDCREFSWGSGERRGGGKG